MTLTLFSSISTFSFFRTIDAEDDSEPIYPSDSGYVNGVFYFSANDRIGVRPLSFAGERERNYANTTTTDSYFGAYMLRSDTNARMADWSDCYRGGNLL